MHQLRKLLASGDQQSGWRTKSSPAAQYLYFGCSFIPGILDANTDILRPYEVICLIQGQVRVHAGDETQPLQGGDSLSIPAGLVHQIENVGSNNAEMTISYSTGDREYAAE
jgi:hypothetical protein